MARRCRLFYENRVPALQLTNEELNEELEGILEDAELDDAQGIQD